MEHGYMEIWLNQCVKIQGHTYMHVHMYMYNVIWTQPADRATSVAQLVRAQPRKLMVVGSSQVFFLRKNICFGRVVLCCFVFLLCCVALPCLSFLASHGWLRSCTSASRASPSSRTAGAEFPRTCICVYGTMHFGPVYKLCTCIWDPRGPGIAHALHADITSLASSARHQCVAFH